MALKLNIKIDLKKIPKGVKIAIAVAPAVIIAVVAVIVVWMPKNKEIKKVTAEISKQNNEIAKSQSMAANLEILKIENEKLKKRFAKLQERLPEKAEVSSLIIQISEEARKSDIDILSWKHEPTKAHPSGIVEEIPFSLTVTGTYHNLGYFFGNLTRLNRIVNISDIKLGNPKVQKDEAMLNISLKASTFSAVKGAGQ